ncbi:MAG: hypothetical protein JWO69_792 [Thermoleophilia bacterium]|nr:hypothetical protein [Thermoleophilia bacterium]
MTNAVAAGSNRGPAPARAAAREPDAPVLPRAMQPRPLDVGIAVLGGVTTASAVALLAFSRATRMATHKGVNVFANPGGYDAQLGAQALKPHQIRRGDVSAHIADSVIPHTFYHASKGSNEALHARGPQRRVDPGGRFSEALYAARVPLRDYGDDITPVVINAKQPFKVRGMADYDRKVAPIVAEYRAAHPDAPAVPKAREQMLALRWKGYDIVHIERQFLGGPQSEWLAILDPAQAKLVVADATTTAGAAS